MTTNMVELQNVSKQFGDNTVVQDVSLQVKEGEFLTLLGPSGCGKTTTLRMIAGFEQPTEGTILLDGRRVDNVPANKRNVNTVFQSYALFPHMNIYDNIAFGLKMRRANKNSIKEKVTKMLELVQLQGFEKRMPSQLSGGQKQRIAIARALINNPKVILLDEPLGALDLKLRKQMQVELKHLQKQLKITFIYVTHDQEEALTMSDRIAVMNKGIVEQIGLPVDIYEKPQTKFVADFIGETNLFEGNVSKVNGRYAYLDLGVKEIEVKNEGLQIGEKVYLTIRPERIHILADGSQEAANSVQLKARFKERIYVGSTSKMVVLLDNGKEVVINEPAGQTQYGGKIDQEMILTWGIDHGVVMKD
ncbi:ABC transporter ATP-binding protein [Ferdinandcohnia quinoae]|uniref:Spermidine/putrescine import ATP-binding protein PotA n=1 Tax=Fredinandcohnia quinoae TaxID=2918902 RepID=A0AAW5E0E0_9BACI|nr:ABC transporter ATP-binding protein [Fredinandcohnia sp. SECRCQ15]MCH1625783.1 ABC transporter ATP-binding protein [Fredinandcohnia sp. SECRCQ15]